jgi:trimethylamine--corrinoid protein Co-methyltransferase
VSPITPLTFTEKVTSAILAAAQVGAKFHPLPCPSMGGTGPITMAGVLALQHAENLAAILIAAAARPGIEVATSSRIQPIDVRTAMSSWSGPEVGLTGAVTAQLAHRHGLASDVYGFCTASATVDPQYSYDKFANAVSPALAGADILSGIGMLENGLSASLEAIVVDDEIAGLIHHLQSGCEVDEETLAFDVMRQVILSDGVFLGELHTVEHMRKSALWMGAITERSPGSDGEAVAGAMARARSRATEILATHTVDPLPDDVSLHLGEIMLEARRELAG